eukprot:NODE_2202_length_653_cov_154.301325_g1859_i0.p2 GENE.NODE_2202_length_653_cov_154.301325_g1859_i0~~NODE_2202_length_653_cov_154.301325_g1859_i0.p2  ORF type:complete len:70 (+),score=28.44 NODE_2202_length_653_cov_154.301325_g1859_i0:297-506(+)
MCIKQLYDEEVLTEDQIMKWYNAKPTKALDKEAQKFFREKTAPFIEWLKSNDSDDDGEDGEEDDDDDED